MSRLNIDIRKITESDIDDVIRINNSLSLPIEDGFLIYEFIKSNIQKIFESNDEINVAIYNNKIVGYIWSGKY